MKTMFRDYPNIAKFIYRKKYIHTDKFNDYRIVLHDYAGLMALFEIDKVPNIREIQERSAIFTKQEAHNFPMFFVNPNLLKAAMQTSIDFEINPFDFHLPFEAFSLILPKNAIRYKNNEVFLFEVSRLYEGEMYNLPKNTKIQMGNNCFSIRAKTANGEDYVKSIIKPFTPSQIESNAPDNGLNQPFCIPLTENDNKFLGQITSIVFNLLFAMQAKPELVETGKRISSIAGKRNFEMWTPNIIGNKYQTKTSGEKGTHSSPRTHWRRGHFRRQPCGVKLSNIKTIWIEPMLVSA